MPPFNITVCAQHAYRTVWAERHYLLKLALIPLLIKLACILAFVAYGDAGNILRQSLFMLPAYFAEGWMLCHFVRLLAKGQRWPMTITGDTTEDLRVAKMRGKPLLAGIISFAIINLVIALYYTSIYSFIPPEMLKTGQMDPDMIAPEKAMMILILMGFMVAGFKYIWAYIALASDITPQSFLRATQGFMMSVRIVGLWAICSIPLIFLMQIFASGFMTEEGPLTFSSQFGIAVIHTIFKTLKNVIVTAAVTYAILQIFGGAAKLGGNQREE